MIRAVALDCDGVLLETVDIKTRAFARLFRDVAPDAHRAILDYHRRHGGVSRFVKFRAIYRDILKQPLSDKEYQRLCDAFASYVEQGVAAAPWVDGAKEFLDAHHQDYLLYVVSGTPEVELKTVLARRGALRYFRDVGGAPATKPMLLERFMLAAGLPRHEMVLVGDAETDWQAAQANGIPFIWRNAPGALAPPTEFSGVRIPSLKQLKESLAAVSRELRPGAVR